MLGSETHAQISSIAVHQQVNRDSYNHDCRKQTAVEHCCLVVAVLRRLIREQEAGTLPEPPLPSADTPLEQAADMMAVATSHPTWMVQRWLRRWGQKDTLALLRHNNRCTFKLSCQLLPSGIHSARPAAVLALCKQCPDQPNGKIKHLDACLLDCDVMTLSATVKFEQSPHCLCMLCCQLPIALSEAM